LWQPSPRHIAGCGAADGPRGRCCPERCLFGRCRSRRGSSCCGRRSGAVGGATIGASPVSGTRWLPSQLARGSELSSPAARQWATAWCQRCLRGPSTAACAATAAAAATAGRRRRGPWCQWWCWRSEGRGGALPGPLTRSCPSAGCRAAARAASCCRGCSQSSRRRQWCWHVGKLECWSAAPPALTGPYRLRGPVLGTAASAGVGLFAVISHRRRGGVGGLPGIAVIFGLPALSRGCGLLLHEIPPPQRWQRPRRRRCRYRWLCGRRWRRHRCRWCLCGARRQSGQQQQERLPDARVCQQNKHQPGPLSKMFDAGGGRRGSGSEASETARGPCATEPGLPRLAEEAASFGSCGEAQRNCEQRR